MKVFIDAEKTPCNLIVETPYVVCRSFSQFQELCSSGNCPEFISLTHNLGTLKKTGEDIVDWLIELDVLTEFNFIPPNFSYFIHTKTEKTNIIDKKLTEHLKRKKLYMDRLQCLNNI